MSKKIIYLHVGPHKTGTTVLQKTCLDNRDLLEANGLKYPDIFFNHLGHHGLVDAIRHKKLNDETRTSFHHLDSNILFSSENFISLSGSDWNYFFDFFSEFEIKIIYAWRRSSGKMYSLWQESIKQGGIKNFTDFYYKELIRPGRSVLLCPHISLDIWSNMLGKENIIIMDYDTSKKEGTLISDFLSIVSIDKNKNKIKITDLPLGVKNEALSPEIVEIIRCLNRLFSMKGKPSVRVREAFFKVRDKISEDIKVISSNMLTYQDTFSIGDYFIDNLTENRVLKDYKTNIINYKKAIIKSEVNTISSDWLLDLNNNQALQDIYKKLDL